MAIKKTQAIVINSMDWSDTSKILSFYTEDYGRIKAVAKGAKRKGSPFTGALEVLYHVDIVYYEKEGRDLQTLSQCSVRRDFPGVKKDLLKTAYCSYFVQMADEISGEKQKSGEIFKLLLDILSHLEDNDPCALLARFYEINLFKAAGYGPVLRKCGSCGGTLGDGPGRMGFSPEAGGAVCGSCMRASGGLVGISGGSLSTLSCLDRIGVGLLDRIQASKTVREEIRSALLAFMDYHFEKKLKSRDFLEKLGGG